MSGISLQDAETQDQREGMLNMKCLKCGAENRDESNFCRYCAAPLMVQDRDPRPGSGYVPSVPPPGASSYSNYSPPANYQQQPQPPARPAVGHIMCPRCGSTSVIKGGISQWAVILAVVGFLVVCFFSLFFLLIKDPNRCLNCGLDFK